MIFSLLGPIIIATLAVAVLFVGVRILLGPLLILFKISSVWHAPLRWGESRALSQSRAALKTAERELQAKGKGSALRLLERSFFLELIRFDSRLIDRAHEHNLAVLQVFLPLVREAPGSRSPMAAVEGLIQTRTQLFTRFFETAISESEMRSRRHAKGTPSWARNEFEKQRADVIKRLVENRAELQLAISQLIAALVAPARSRSDDVTFH